MTAPLLVQLDAELAFDQRRLAELQSEQEQVTEMRDIAQQRIDVLDGEISAVVRRIARREGEKAMFLRSGDD